MWQLEPVADLNQSYRYSQPGDTSLDSLATESGRLLLKNEQENPTGSFKDRSLAYQLGSYLADGKDGFVISSSGNAALAAAAICAEAGAELNIFISPKADKEKRKQLLAYAEANDSITLREHEKAKSQGIKFAEDNNLINLRGSKDDLALPGFATIADELLEQNSKIDAIFVPCSSATSSVAIGRRFRELGKNVAVHICQTARIHPIAAIFDDNFTRSETSLADCVVDRVASRRPEITELIYDTEGFGWVIEDKDLEAAKAFISEYTDTEYTYNALLSVAGWQKAVAQGYAYQFPVAVMSGT